jgi:hypothetical protein
MLLDQLLLRNQYQKKLKTLERQINQDPVHLFTKMIKDQNLQMALQHHHHHLEFKVESQGTPIKISLLINLLTYQTSSLLHLIQVEI